MVTEVNSAELSALINRVEYAIEHELALPVEDLQLLLQAITTLMTLQEKLDENDVTLHKLRKLLGMVRQSESRRGSGQRGSKTKNKKPKSKSNRPKTKPKTEHHKLESHHSGDCCPHCEKGKLYKFEPGSLLRITGHCPYQATQHVTERLRCNACQGLVTASLPEEVLADGKPEQKYGYTARALMAIHKFYSGIPYNHQGVLSDLMGHSLTASTVFDQCEHVANSIMPLFRSLQRLAADAVSFLIDDTHAKILEQKPELRPNRNGKGKRLRTGIYGSGLIANTADKHEIVLFETSLGHAGEHLDAILAKRSEKLPVPLLMSDALSANLPKNAQVKSTYCNAHCRRQFYDLEEKHPEAVAWVLEQYGKIWEFEAETVTMTPEERLAYHREHSLPVMEALKSWALEQQSDERFEEHSVLGKAINYLLKHYEKLTRFCHEPGALIDNNRMEETLKIIIRNRKTAHFFKTVNGAGIANVLTSVIATSVRNDVNIFEYLTALQRYQEKVAENPEDWVPWKYLETLDKLETNVNIVTTNNQGSG